MLKIPLPKSGSVKSATFIGYGSVILWSLSGILTAAVSGIPTFEVLAIAFGVSFILSSLGCTFWGSVKNLKRPAFTWILGVVGIYGSESLYVSAFKYAPAAHVDIISSLWPIFVILFSVFIPNEKFVARYLVAAIIGFLGMYCIVFGDQQWISVSDNHWLGYLLALLGAGLACVYTLTTHSYSQSSIETTCIYAGFCFLFSLLLHFNFEATVMPTTMEWLTLISMGILTQGLAYLLWNHGVRFGNYRLLSIASYCSPVISIFLLILFGFANVTPYLLVACTLMFAACFIAKTSEAETTPPQLEAANI